MEDGTGASMDIGHWIQAFAGRPLGNLIILQQPGNHLIAGGCPVPSEWVGGRDEGRHLRIIMMPAWIRLLARL